MATWELFDHTADVGLRVHAEDLDSLFRAAAEGLFDTIVSNREEVGTDEVEEVALEADGPALLLAGWLNELIYRCETSHRLYGRFEVRVAEDGRSLSGTIAGEAIDRARHVLDHEVKAATHHDLRVERRGDGWLAEVILDI